MSADMAAQDRSISSLVQVVSSIREKDPKKYSFDFQNLEVYMDEFD